MKSIVMSLVVTSALTIFQCRFVAATEGPSYHGFSCLFKIGAHGGRTQIYKLELKQGQLGPPGLELLETFQNGQNSAVEIKTAVKNLKCSEIHPTDRRVVMCKVVTEKGWIDVSTRIVRTTALGGSGVDDSQNLIVTVTEYVPVDDTTSHSFRVANNKDITAFENTCLLN